MTTKPDDSRPFNHETGEQPVFDPSLQSERMREIQEAAVVMQRGIQRVVNTCDWSIDELYEYLLKHAVVKNYLAVAGETLGRPFVKQAFSMAIRNYINSKE